MANGSVFDLLASERTSLHQGIVRDRGPWVVGRFTFATIKRPGPAAKAWATFEAATRDEGPDWRARLEGMLPSLYGDDDYETSA